MLIFRFIVRESLCVFLYDEPARASRGVGENRVGIGDSAIADPLLVAVDFVTDDAAILKDSVCGRAECSQIAARFRFGGAVSKQQSFIRDAAQPEFLLFGRGSDSDWIATQKSRQHGCSNAQIDASHFFADAIHVEGAAAHSAKLFRNEQELNAQLVRAAHMADDLQRAFVALIQS